MKGGQLCIMIHMGHSWREKPFSGQRWNWKALLTCEGIPEFITNSFLSMGIPQGLKQLVKKVDFFNSFQMLRYEKETQYRTFTGGLISVAIITTIIIAFASMILDTLNRTSIDFTQNTLRLTDPSLSTIVTSPENNFMFGVEVWGYNLSSEGRLFDVVFTQIQSNYGDNYTSTNYPLEACTAAHWEMLPDVVSSLDRLAVGNWLCPSIGTVIKLQGRYSSEYYHQFSVTLLPCSNQTDPLRPCGSPEEISQYFIENGQWNYFTYYYVNSVVNPAQPQYKSYYLEDRTYIVFGPQMGAELDLYLNEIDIETDSSIWPFQQLSQDTLYSINFSPILYPFAVNNSTSFATFYVMKDPTQVTYSRAVQKIFVVFSFMGGLIGAVMAGLFIVNSYTSFAYELALALAIFKESERSLTHRELRKEEKSTINLIHYLQYHIYSLLTKVTTVLNWPFTQYVHECREEIHEQLDIKGLIKRIIFLEYAISYVLEDYHLAEMQLKRPVLPSQIKALREKILAKEALEEEEGEEGEEQKESEESGKGVLPGELDSVVQKDTPQPLGSRQLATKVNVYVDQIRAEVISYEGEIGHRVANEYKLSMVKKHSIHLKRLKESAIQGNPISRKLLRMGGSEAQDGSSQLQNISCAGFLNKKAASISKIDDN